MLYRLEPELTARFSHNAMLSASRIELEVPAPSEYFRQAKDDLIQLEKQIQQQVSSFARERVEDLTALFSFRMFPDGFRYEPGISCEALRTALSSRISPLRRRAQAVTREATETKTGNEIEIIGCGQKKIYSLEDWAAYGLPVSRRDLHWKEGRSAFELARTWTDPGRPSVPKQVSELLNSHEDLRDVEILSGFVEHETKLPFGERGPRCHDLMVCAVRHGEPVTICIEAKADETFGGTIQAELEKALASARKRSGVTRFPERLDWLTRFLFSKSVFTSMGITTLEPAFSGLFYQLFSAIGGTLIEAKMQRASAAVLIFNEFRTHATEDRKLQLNADALNSFLRVFLHANGRAGETLAEGNILGPIRINPNVPDLGVEIPIGIPLYIGKIRTDRLAETSV